MYATIYDEAIAKGKLAGQQHMLLRLLDERGLSLTESLRERVLACAHEAQLLEWFDRSLTAEYAREVFGTAGE